MTLILLHLNKDQDYDLKINKKLKEIEKNHSMQLIVSTLLGACHQKPYVFMVLYVFNKF